MFEILEHASLSPQRETGLDRLDAAIDWVSFRSTLLELVAYEIDVAGYPLGAPRQLTGNPPKRLYRRFIRADPWLTTGPR